MQGNQADCFRSKLENSFEESNQNFEEAFIGSKRMFRCLYPDCGKIFRFRSEMMRHLTTHSDARLYFCTYPSCGKSFKRIDALNNHYKIHTETTAYQCNYPNCKSRFNSKASLNYHVLKHGEKNFVCSFPGCDRAFATYTQVKQHEKAFLYHQRNILKDSSLDSLKDNQIYCLGEILPNFNKTDAVKSQSKNLDNTTNINDTVVPAVEQEDKSHLVVEVENLSQNTSTPDQTQNSSNDKTEQNNFNEQSLMTLIKKAFRENKELQKQLQETEAKILQIHEKEEVAVDAFFNLSPAFSQNKNENQLETPLDYSLNLGDWDFLRREAKL